jgi:hypothetical protein
LPASINLETPGSSGKINEFNLGATEMDNQFFVKKHTCFFTCLENHDVSREAFPVAKTST